MNELLELVRKNGRETSENLAKMLGISEEEVMNQLEALEADVLTIEAACAQTVRKVHPRLS